MSKLDDILSKYGNSTALMESGEYNNLSDLLTFETAKQQIKDLFNELVGEDIDSEDSDEDLVNHKTGHNCVKAELRRKVENL